MPIEYTASDPELTLPAGTQDETADTPGDGSRQVVLVHTDLGTSTTTDPAPDSTADLLLAANADRISAIIAVEAGSVTVYLGADSGVTSSPGFPLAAGETFTDRSSVDAWWGITASGTADVRVTETTI